MASHSAYPHVLHHQHPQPTAHLPPPPLSNIAQAPNQRLPSLRSLNFAYPRVGEPGSTAIEGSGQPQQRGDQAPRTPFTPQQEEYYHQRDMSYYQGIGADAASSSAHPAPSAKRPRSNSNPGQRSPYIVHSSSSTYPPQTHDAAQGRTTAAGSFPQGHPQGNQQGHTQYAPTAHHQQSEAGHSYYSRLPQAQPSQAWYYPQGHQPAQQQQQHASQQHSPQQHSPQQHTPQQHASHQPPVNHQHAQQQQQHQHQHHQPQQQQQQAPQPQQPPQKPLHFQQYPTANPSHSPHQAPGQVQAPPRASFPTTHQQPQPQPPPESSPVLATFGSPSTPGFASSGSALNTGTASARTVTIDTKALGEDAERAAASGMHLSKITEHSSVLCEFANRYGQLPHLRPSPSEVAEMAQRASLVLKLVEHMRQIASSMQPQPAEKERERDRVGEGDEKRSGKKRPWEDAGEDAAAAGVGSGEENQTGASFEIKDAGAIRSVADQDMAIIRSKRGQGAGGAGTSPGGTQKAKYRKRSRATPPGKCHSCNIRETPEWRRGPDGARTLCNACGLHYAKLIRKRDKTLGSSADTSAPPIDLEMLRQSTRTADAANNNAAKSDGGGFRGDDMAEIQLQPVGMQVHLWTPPGVQQTQQRDDGYAYATSLMRSSNARGSPA